jgi:hypothetical protein
VSAAEIAARLTPSMREALLKMPADGARIDLHNLAGGNLWGAGCIRTVWMNEITGIGDDDDVIAGYALTPLGIDVRAVVALEAAA